jgi:DivIVA domain-containing protein
VTSPLSPDDVAQRTFPTSFRGFEPGEVRGFLGQLAGQLREAEARAAELAEKLAAAEQRAAHPQLDVETLTTALGEETARILKSAQDAAHDIRTKAEENIAQLLRDAYEEASRVRAEAELVLARETEVAEAASSEIRAAAAAEAESAMGRARQEAERLLGEVESKARLIVEDAETLRAQVLGDLARRRRVAHAQVEQLRAGRERLLAAYRVVRSTLDEVTEELAKAEGEARQAAEDTARRLASETPPAGIDEDVLAEFDQAPAPAPAQAPEIEPVTASEREPVTASEPEPVTAPEPEIEPEAGPLAEDPPLPEEEAEAAAVELPPTRRLAGNPVAPPLGSPTEEWRMSSLRIIRRPKVEQLEPEPEPEPLAEDRPLPEEAAEPAPAASAVDELFARIRAEGAEAAKPEATKPEATKPEAAKPEATESEPKPAPLFPQIESPGTDSANKMESASKTESANKTDEDADEALLQRRDAALEEVEQRLARRLKRALQDDHNDVLDRLRVHRGPVSAPSLLPSAEVHPTPFREVAASLLAEAAAAGARFLDLEPSDAKLDDLVSGLADDVTGPLRRRLERSLDEGTDEEHALIVERVGAAYREAKGRRIEQLAGDYAVAAFSRGVLAAVDDGMPLRWIVDDDGEPCPDCDDNALAGATPCGEAYPTGQAHPPAHAGCRCLVVPAAH